MLIVGHSEPASAAFALRQIHFIHEGPNDQDSPSTRFQKIGDIGRIRDAVERKTLSLILDYDLDCLAIGRNSEGGFFGGIGFIAVLDGIDHGFTDREFDPVCHLFGEPVFPYRLSNQRVDSLHFFEPARNCQLEAPWLLQSHRP